MKSTSLVFVLLAVGASAAGAGNASHCAASYGEGAQQLCSAPGLSFGMKFLNDAVGGVGLGENPAITAYKKFRGADAGALDAQIRAALNSSDVMGSLSSWATEPGFMCVAQPERTTPC